MESRLPEIGIRLGCSRRQVSVDRVKSPKVGMREIPEWQGRDERRKVRMRRETLSRRTKLIFWKWLSKDGNNDGDRR